MSQNKKIDGIIKDAGLIRFYKEESPKTHIDLALLMGQFLKDYTGGFTPEPGNVFRTSPVVSVEGNLVQTQNRLYQIEGALREYLFPLSAALWVADHIPPETIQAMLDNGMKPDNQLN